MEDSGQYDSDSKIGTYTEEIENGIFSMVISLCQQKAVTMPIDEAKREAAEFLQKLIDGLQT